MENATRALVMAGGVLISIIIITLLILMFNNLTHYQEAENDIKFAEELAKFNNQYITYNRKNVRGNEILTLANKMISHNETRATFTTSGATPTTFEGIGYDPMELKINLKTRDGSKNARDEFKYTTSCVLFTNDSYVVSENRNTFKDQVYDVIKKKFMSASTVTGGTGEWSMMTEDKLDKMASAITSIFYQDAGDYDDTTVTSDNPYGKRMKLIKAINKFNVLYGKKILKLTTDSDLDKSASILKGDTELEIPITSTKTAKINIREAVEQYYEYKQFKRARFDCELSNGNDGAEYYPNQRIKSMTFYYNGTIN